MQNLPHECLTPRTAEQLLDDTYTFLTAGPSSIDAETIDLIEKLSFALSDQLAITGTLGELLSVALEHLQTQNQTIDELRGTRA